MRPLTIDRARYHTALVRTLAAFPVAAADDVRRVFSVVWFELEQMQIHQEGSDQTPEQQRALLRDRCCQLVGPNEEVCRVVIVAASEIYKHRSFE